MLSLEMECIYNVIRNPIFMDGMRLKYIHVTALIENAHFNTITYISHLVYMVYI